MKKLQTNAQIRYTHGYNSSAPVMCWARDLLGRLFQWGVEIVVVKSTVRAVSGE